LGTTSVVLNPMAAAAAAAMATPLPLAASSVASSYVLGGLAHHAAAAPAPAPAAASAASAVAGSANSGAASAVETSSGPLPESFLQWLVQEWPKSGEQQHHQLQLQQPGSGTQSISMYSGSVDRAAVTVAPNPLHRVSAAALGPATLLQQRSPGFPLQPPTNSSAAILKQTSLGPANALDLGNPANPGQPAQWVAPAPAVAINTSVTWPQAAASSSPIIPSVGSFRRPYALSASRLASAATATSLSSSDDESMRTGDEYPVLGTGAGAGTASSRAVALAAQERRSRRRLRHRSRSRSKGRKSGVFAGATAEAASAAAAAPDSEGPVPVAGLEVQSASLSPSPSEATEPNNGAMTASEALSPGVVAAAAAGGRAPKHVINYLARVSRAERRIARQRHAAQAAALAQDLTAAAVVPPDYDFGHRDGLGLGPGTRSRTGSSSHGPRPANGVAVDDGPSPLDALATAVRASAQHDRARQPGVLAPDPSASASVRQPMEPGDAPTVRYSAFDALTGRLLDGYGEAPGGGVNSGAGPAIDVPVDAEAGLAEARLIPYLPTGTGTTVAAL
jgi:hypothetical protein